MTLEKLRMDLNTFRLFLYLTKAAKTSLQLLAELTANCRTD